MMPKYLIVIKRTCQIMMLLLMLASLAIKPTIIDWFTLPFVITLPLNWIMFSLIGVLFLITLIYK